jgi:putative membrane protein
VQFVLNVLISTFAVWLAAGIIPGLDWQGELWQILVIGVIVGLVNAIVKPLLTLLSLPFLVITLGLFYLVVNWAVFALVVWMSGPDNLDLGLTSTSGWATFFGSIVVSLASLGLSMMAGPRRRV